MDYNGSMLNVTRYGVSHPDLKKLIKFFWHLETDKPVEVKHTLIPTDSIDVIINLDCPLYYAVDGKITEAGPCHFNGMREVASTIIQKGQLRLFGISFEPYGLYPFIKTPIDQFTNRIVTMGSICPSLAAELEHAVSDHQPSDLTISSLEAALARHLGLSRRIADSVDLLQSFLNSDASINGFCEQACIDIKRLERLCLRYTGFSPKKLKRVLKVETASNQIIKMRSNDSLTTLAYDNEYYDQSHLIREFRSFLGVPPDQFRRSHLAVKAVMKYLYK